MSQDIRIVALLYPKEESVPRFEELFNAFFKEVHSKEPDCSQYLMTKRVQSDELTYIMIETYKDKQAAEGHGQTQHFKDLVDVMTKEGIMAKPMSIMYSMVTGGFDSDRKLL